MIKIKRGLTVPITGSPTQTIHKGPTVRTVALIGTDYVGMKPTMLVKEGDTVKCGQALFEDKKNPGILFTAPASGQIAAINRGHKRVLQSVVIDIKERSGEGEVFAHYKEGEIDQLEGALVEENLVKSGLWTALRTRPFSRVPALGSRPNSIFVNAMDTNPLSANPEVVLKQEGWGQSFVMGLRTLKRLTDGKVFLCKAPNANIPTASCVTEETFEGPHPAGLAGTHIHHLDPVSSEKTVWTINYQDVVAIGRLFIEGKLFTDRVVALAGPQVTEPRLVTTRLGASTDELTAGQLQQEENRVISGSVLNGFHARSAHAFLGRYHQQVSVIQEGRERFLLDFFRLGVNKFSVLNTFISKLTPQKRFSFTSASNGSPRGMVPVGAYERVMPLDILPTQLLRALIVGDSVSAQELGCLELDEEDLGLLTFVCPCKYEYGPILRDNLTSIEQEG